MQYYSKEKGEVLRLLNSQSEGLSSQEALKRQEQYGKNRLEEKKKKTLLKKIIEQIKDPVVLVLIIASIISGFLGETVDMVIILLIVVINTVIGLVQESKSEKAIEALKKMSAQSAKVVRDGRVSIISAEDLVPGDIVTLDAGDLIPADLRLLESSNLRIEEASLTGESVPSEKDAKALPKEDASIGDRLNMAYYGTSITYGRASGVICEIGMQTEMGKIATMINNTEEESTPLQQKLAEIGKLLTFVVLGICLVVFVTVVLKNGGFTLDNTLEAFMISVSLAVAAIPEGLPAVVTIVMAMGVTRMAKRKAIIKKLPAVETLGCAEVICSDKTGTLTMNKMDVKAVYIHERLYSAQEYLDEKQNLLIEEILYLCNDSVIDEDGNEIGDPTETCLKRFVLQKQNKDNFKSKIRILDLPFDSERKMMSTVNVTSEGEQVYSKGAPDELIKACKSILINGKVKPLTQKDQENILKANKEMASKALRVLGTAYKPYDQNEKALEKDLVFVGLIGMMDPPRVEVFEALKTCKSAGIMTIMITGDHKETAIAIGKEIGLIDDASQAMLGSELDPLSDEELDKILNRVKVYARVSPEHKVRIVKAWRRQGKVVAMTGDGVNDAPALKIADIGIGMGITGTDVSKGVSDMLLSDDNFATIVNAVEEGRKIYRNIRKAVQFLLSSNISEVLALFTATLILPSGVLFLGPIHILWINLVTDAFPAIGLGMDEAESGLMKEKPRNTKKSFFANGLGINIAYQGALLATITLIAYFIGNTYSPEIATTMAFLTLSTVQLVHSFNMKSQHGTVFTRRIFKNTMLNFGAMLPMVLMILIINVPFLNDIFKVVSLNGTQWAICVGLAFIALPVVEVIKAIQRKIKKA